MKDNKNSDRNQYQTDRNQLTRLGENDRTDDISAKDTEEHALKNTGHDNYSQ